MAHRYFCFMVVTGLLVCGWYHPVALQAEPHALVICGSGGTQEFVQRFQDWGRRLSTALHDDLGFPQSNITFFLSDIADATEDEAIECNVKVLEFHFNLLADSLSATDDLYLFMIGHGGYINNTLTFHLPGEDLTASHLEEWLSGLTYRHLILINGSSSSAGFINKISRERRVICTATKSVTESNAPEFMEHFIQAIRDGSADTNRDERITVYEACRQAAVLTQAWYDQEGYLATEHALLDDNGDGLGTRLISDTGEDVVTSLQNRNTQPDGKLAEQIYLKDYLFPDKAPQESIQEYLQALQDIQAWKMKKDELDRPVYYQQLEAKLIHAASLHQYIRSFQ